ncbi:MAG: alpha/beta hydrolase [Ktedonobacteraceae bacterium]
MSEQRNLSQHPLVFIHGSGDSGRVWRFQTEHVGTQSTFALDLPGHGQRPDTLPAEITVQEYTQAAHDIIMQELHLHKPIIVGHSLGGAIALTMALEYGNELGGIVLVGTGARLRILPAILADAKNTPEQARQRLSQMAMAPTTVASVSQAVVQEQVTPGPTILYRDLAACDLFDIMQRLYEISIPTLVICGTEDQLTPVKYSSYLHQHISGSTLRVIPNAGHYVMREQPEAVNQAIDEWLQVTFSPSTY